MVRGFMKFYSVCQEEIRDNQIKEQARNSVQGFMRHTVNYLRGLKEMGKKHIRCGTQDRALYRS